jgi:hypothetical protein
MNSHTIPNELTQTNEKMKDVIIRTRSAGVFAGKLSSFKSQTATLKKARRIWYWSGAASLSQLATDGTSRPDQCKFPVEVEEVILPEVIEILPLTKKARASIDAVKVWSV